MIANAADGQIPCHVKMESAFSESAYPGDFSRGPSIQILPVPVRIRAQHSAPWLLRSSMFISASHSHRRDRRNQLHIFERTTVLQPVLKAGGGNGSLWQSLARVRFPWNQLARGILVQGWRQQHFLVEKAPHFSLGNHKTGISRKLLAIRIVKLTRCKASSKSIENLAVGTHRC